MMMEILDALFGPLARLLVARGILFPDLSERMKAHYVQAAGALSQGRATDSRLSVMTGLQRRDIVRLKGFEPKPQRVNHLVRLVALWQTAPAWQAPDGAPRILPRAGPAPSFEALAREVRRDVHARTMLDALLATGTVVLEDDGQAVRLVKTSYQPLAGSEDQIAYLADNLGDHMRAATDNVLGRTPPHFERAVHYTGLTEAQMDELAESHRAGQMALFEALSRRAAAMKAETGGAGQCRFRAGGYFYSGGGEDVE